VTVFNFQSKLLGAYPTSYPQPTRLFLSQHATGCSADLHLKVLGSRQDADVTHCATIHKISFLANGSANRSYYRSDTAAPVSHVLHGKLLPA
jgi:hypothetical protein